MNWVEPPDIVPKRPEKQNPLRQLFARSTDIWTRNRAIPAEPMWPHARFADWTTTHSTVQNALQLKQHFMASCFSRPMRPHTTCKVSHELECNGSWRANCDRYLKHMQQSHAHPKPSNLIDGYATKYEWTCIINVLCRCDRPKFLSLAPRIWRFPQETARPCQMLQTST